MPRAHRFQGLACVCPLVHNRFLLRRPALVADKPLTLDVDDFAAALRFCGYDADTDEAECILANVIAKVRAVAVDRKCASR